MSDFVINLSAHFAWLTIFKFFFFSFLNEFQWQLQSNIFIVYHIIHIIRIIRIVQSNQ